LVDDVSKVYADRGGHPVEALAGVTFTVEAEELVAVVGPSGCGKSTLLNMVAGLLPPSAGSIAFEGALPPGRPPTAMVFQEFALFPWRTVQANVELGLEETGGPAGERQPVGIARALAVDPAVLLMDEPFSALDAQTRQLMQEELLAIWERTRKTILYVTHNIHEAEWMADRVVVLSRRPGRVLDIVPVELKRPRTEAMAAEPALLQAVERIWALIKSQAREALREGAA